VIITGTLLNALFGTDFSTMNSSSGRSQTTLGTYTRIWMGKSADANILVMDVEGVDGQAFGEDKLIERRYALFSLATAEVLVVNMHEITIGLYNGANVGLLETVFEANLQLSEGKGLCHPHRAGKTLLFFVIRDYTGQTSLAHNEDKLRGNMARIWKSIEKPKHLENSSFSDFFDCMVVGLPPKPYMPEQFNEAVDKLRLRFTDLNHSDYVFKPCYQRKIPIDGFSCYAFDIWDAILPDRTLSISAQQVLLAKYRCAELRLKTESAFKESISAIESQINGGKLVDGLGKLMEKERSKAVVVFDASAKHYHQDVYTEMRGKLYKAFDEKSTVLFRSQIGIVAEQTFDQFNDKMWSLHVNSILAFIESTQAMVLDALEDLERAVDGMCANMHAA
ncbi:RHD3/Sey1, partial [Thamnocephalis sphaerospora]